MRILFVSTNTNPLEPPINGDAQRTCLLYEACKRIAEVDVVTFAGQEEHPKRVGRWKKWTALLPWSATTALFPVDPEREAVVDAAIQNTEYDLIVARYFYRAIPCGLWKYHDRLVIDFDDALPFFFLNQINPKSAMTSRIRLRWSARRAETITRQAVRKMKMAFFAEETVAKANHAVFLPNIPYYSGECADADMSAEVKRIVFVGQLEYKPNREGVDRFLERVYQPLTQRLPKLELHLVGVIGDETLRQRWQRYPGVTVTGFVDDLRQEYAESHVAVVPVYQCGATNIKLLEAMSMNRACVTTQEALEKTHGRFEKGRDLMAACSDEEFFEMMTRLLTDEKENLRIAHNGKAAMDRYYSLNVFCDIVANQLTH